jgi:hypothetical protein
MEPEKRMELVVRTAAKLSPEDRHRVAERILDVQDEHALNAGDRCKAIVSAAERVIGCELDGTRSLSSVTIRRFVSWRMRQEGYTFYDIAGAIGVDHSTVHHYVRTMREEFELPSVFRNDLGLYHQFNEMLDKDVEQVRQ